MRVYKLHTERVKSVRKGVNDCWVSYITCRLDAALDLEILVTEPYTGDYFLQEIKGLADATGINYRVPIFWSTFIQEIFHM